MGSTSIFHQNDFKLSEIGVFTIKIRFTKFYGEWSTTNMFFAMKEIDSRCIFNSKTHSERRCDFYGKAS